MNVVSMHFEDLFFQARWFSASRENSWQCQGTMIFQNINTVGIICRVGVVFFIPVARNNMLLRTDWTRVADSPDWEGHNGAAPH